MATLDFKSLHGPGRCSVAYTFIEGQGLRLATAGADGKVVLRDADSPDHVIATHDAGQPVECIAVDPLASGAKFVAVGVDLKTQVGPLLPSPVPPPRVTALVRMRSWTSGRHCDSGTDVSLTLLLAMHPAMQHDDGEGTL